MHRLCSSAGSCRTSTQTLCNIDAASSILCRRRSHAVHALPSFKAVFSSSIWSIYSNTPVTGVKTSNSKIQIWRNFLQTLGILRHKTKIDLRICYVMRNLTLLRSNNITSCPNVRNHIKVREDFRKLSRMFELKYIIYDPNPIGSFGIWHFSTQSRRIIRNQTKESNGHFLTTAPLFGVNNIFKLIIRLFHKPVLWRLLWVEWIFCLLSKMWN